MGTCSFMLNNVIDLKRNDLHNKYRTTFISRSESICAARGDIVTGIDAFESEILRASTGDSEPFRNLRGSRAAGNPRYQIRAN